MILQISDYEIIISLLGNSVIFCLGFYSGFLPKLIITILSFFGNFLFWISSKCIT